MKNNKYTKKQIAEAISYWRNELAKTNESLDGDGPVAGYLVTETEGPDKGWDKEWMQGERETNVIGLYRTEEDAKAAAEAIVFDWLKRMDLQDQVIDLGYWRDHVDAEIFNDATKERDFRNRAKAKQLFV